MEQSRRGGDGTRRVGSNKRQIYSTGGKGKGLAGDEGGKQASTGKEARQAGKHAGRQAGQASKQARQACETLPIAVGRGCIDQDEAGRRSLPTPLFPLLALFLPLLAPTRRRVLFLRSFCSTLPFFSLVLTATSVPLPLPRGAKQRRHRRYQQWAISHDQHQLRRSSKVYSFSDAPDCGKKSAAHLALSVFLASSIFLVLVYSCRE